VDEDINLLRLTVPNGEQNQINSHIIILGDTTATILKKLYPMNLDENGNATIIALRLENRLLPLYNC
jgi:hypothetical protein